MLVGNEFIFKKATQIVKECIAEGFWINPKSNGGSDGSEFNVDLRNDDTIVNISIEKRYEGKHSLHNYHRIKSINVYVRTIDDDEYLFQRSIIWKSKMKLISQINYYEIAEDVYTDSLNEIQKISEKQYDRCKNKAISHIRVINADKKKLVQIVNKHKGYKTIKAKDISCLIRDERTNVYTIKFNNSKKNLIILRMC